MTLTLGVLLLHAAWYRDYFSDDAYISLRYARRLLGGRGLTWTDGERVEGYSNLLWTLACAGLGALGVDLVAAARILGAAAMAGALVLAARAQRSLVAALLVASLLAVAGPIAIWTVGGLEPPFQALFLVWAMAGALAGRPAFGWGVPLAGLALTRPDGVVLIAALLAARMMVERSAAPAAGAVWPATALLGQLGFRLAYYHAWLPNTAWAKLRLGAATLRAGGRYLAEAGLPFSGLLLLAVMGFTLGERRRVVLIGLPLVVWCLYVAAVGGDFMPGHRMLVPALVLLALAAGESVAGWSRFAGDGKIRLALVTALGFVWFTLAQLNDPENLAARAQTWAADGVKLGELLRRGLGERRPLVALDAAGAIAYASELPALDMLGLCDRYLALHPPPFTGHLLPGHMLGDGNYVLGRRPDLVIFRGPYGGDPMFTGGLQMRADPRFAEYRAITFAEGSLRAQVEVRLEGRAGITSGGESLEVPGWLFASVPGNLARLDEAGRLEGELTAPASVPTGRMDLTTLESDPSGVPLQLSSDGMLTVQPGATTVHLRSVRLR